MLERVNYLWLAFAEGVASAASPPNLNFFRRPWNFGDETSRNVNSGGEATSHFSSEIEKVLRLFYSWHTRSVPKTCRRASFEEAPKCKFDALRTSTHASLRRVGAS